MYNAYPPVDMLGQQRTNSQQQVPASDVALRAILQGSGVTPGQQSWITWMTSQNQRALNIDVFRRYMAGNHRAWLTDEMARLLRIVSSVGMSPFNLNHCDNVVQTMVDRLELQRVEADNDEATAWIQAMFTANRLDNMQIAVHESAIRDGDTFVMVDFDNASKSVRITHEEAYNGNEGVLLVYPDNATVEPVLGVKVWQINISQWRVNLYYPDKIRRYMYADNMQLMDESAWVDRQGAPLGVPFAHFRNRGTRVTHYGQSELQAAVPIQDAINRVMVSMVMTGELTAFPIRWVVGMKPPQGVTPGMWLQVYAQDQSGAASAPDETAINWFNSVKFGQFEQGQVTPFLDELRFLIAQMYTITKTPLPEFMGSSTASGEALKQRESGLLGKVKRAQISFGNAWEYLAMMAARVGGAYGVQQPPVFNRLYARWRSAQLRDEAVVIDNALKIRDLVGDRETMRQVGDVYGWDADKVDKLMSERGNDGAARLAAVMNASQRMLPGFEEGF